MVVEILKKLIEFKSITPDEAGSFEYIKSLLPDFKAIEIQKNGVKNLILIKKFDSGVHLSFAGHLDVVPAGDGWENDPFKAIEKNGYIYGRGSQDMKSGVASFICAVKNIKKFKGTISLLLTSDEEGDGVYGTQEILYYLKDRNMLPDLAIVAEPTCSKVFGDTIKIGRRGSVNGVLEIFGTSGHAAYPEKSINPIHLSSKVLQFLSEIDLDNGDKYFASSKLIITDIRSGYEITNLTPAKLKLMFNVRNSTNTTKKSIKKYIRLQLKTAKIKNYKLKLTQGSYPFVTKNKKLFNTLKKSIKKITKIKAKPSTSGGTSDARYIGGSFGIDVIEFGVINDRIHAANERVKIKEIKKLTKIFNKFIKFTNI